MTGSLNTAGEGVPFIKMHGLGNDFGGGARTRPLALTTAAAAPCDETD